MARPRLARHPASGAAASSSVTRPPSGRSPCAAGQRRALPHCRTGQLPADWLWPADRRPS